MLATMATVTTGLMSPNSYGLTTADQVVGGVVQMTTEPDYGARFRSYNNSSDSEPESNSSYHHLPKTSDYQQSTQLLQQQQQQQQQPKRNKRKNFEPRCSNTYSDELSSPLNNEATNNISTTTTTPSNNNRRRKTTTARKLIVEQQQPNATSTTNISFYPMDLSKPLTDEESDNDSNSSSTSEEDEYNSFSNNTESDDNGTGGEKIPHSGGGSATQIPSSFSIHNLSKPHVAGGAAAGEFSIAAAAAAAAAAAMVVPSSGGGGVPTGLGGGQNVSEMREYAMNTMRELLGIYGLTSEVAESISKQLPIAAFSSGKTLENLTLHAKFDHHHHHSPLARHTPPSQPPTPPSTPLSPKTSETTPNHHQQQQQQQLLQSLIAASSSSSHTQHRSSNSATTTTSSSDLPHITITQHSHQSGNNNNNNSGGSMTRTVTSGDSSSSTVTRKVMGFTNGAGGGAGGGGGGVLMDYEQMLEQQQQQQQQQQHGGDRQRRPSLDNGDSQKSSNSSRGIFPNLLHFGGVKLEDSVSPPLDLNPLNAMIAQSLLPASLANHLRGEMTSSSGHYHHHHHHHSNHNSSPASNTNATQNSSSGGGSGSGSTTNKPQTQLDYTKYVKKFASAHECGSPHCRDLAYREHFHCLDCSSNARVFLKKEEMIRHFKWHKKRDESLQHGFMRYSPLDDCASDRYINCTHNKKQTHYHCIKEGCDKVYISTSDVQMHANYHRKDSAIIQEGFQRYRATEECGASYCAFFGQRTTHFHCRRSGCKYTFKNKSDMEKHKTYHIKDEQLARDGFKKFMKNEACPYDSCRFSKVCNHIHCIRPQCNYVLHSSGQLFSHKRKHDRQDSELAYRKYKLAQSMLKTYHQDGSQTTSSAAALQQHYEQQLEGLNLSLFGNNNNVSRTGSNVSNASETMSEEGGRNSPLSYEGDNSASAMDLSGNDGGFYDGGMAGGPLDWNMEEFWRKYCQLFGAQDGCVEDCEYAYSEHYHCLLEHCRMVFNCKDGAKEHARNHEQQEQITDNFYTTITSQNGGCDSSCIYQDKEKHYHCNWDNCREVILPTDKPFRRLEHYKMHQYSHKLSLTADPLTMTHLATSVDGMFCRKRGRPPKNRVIEVWNEYAPAAGQTLMDSPQAIFTSFKLPKMATVVAASAAASVAAVLPSSQQQQQQMVLARVEQLQQQQRKEEEETACDSDERSNTPSSIIDYGSQGFDIYPENSKCPDTLCPYLGHVHYHCTQSRCLYVTDKQDTLLLHAKDFHDNIDILAGFEFYDRNVDCRLEGCASNKLNRHFHCTRDGCRFSFVQYSAMALHQQKHESGGGGGGGGSNRVEELLGEKVTTMATTAAMVDNGDENSKAVNLSSGQQDRTVSVVKASGTFFPLSSILQDQCNSPIDTTIKSTITESSSHQTTITTPTLTGDISGSNNLYGPDISCSRPFCKLKRKYHYHCNACNQAFSEIDRLVVHVAKHSTGALLISQQQQQPSTPTTTEDNNNQQQHQQLQPTNTPSPKINVAPLASLQNPVIIKTEDTATATTTGDLVPHPYSLPSTPTFDTYTSHFGNFAGLAPHHLAATQFALQPFLQQQYAVAAAAAAGVQIPAHLMFPGAHHMLAGGNGVVGGTGGGGGGGGGAGFGEVVSPNSGVNMTSPLAAMAANLNKRALSPSNGHDMTPEAKKARIQNSMRILKDEPVPEGYLRFRFNEDCQYQHCGYREHQTHFHCQRQDCGYSFCDKTRFVQHTARHERLDTLMGGDFQQYRANVPCGRPDCAYTANLGATQNKASHFHCMKCEFVCTDTNKVVAHRRQHQKLDSIQAAGFEKFTPSQHCRGATCQHSGKQTHYHCLQCQYAVLGLAQMSAHKYRHMDTA